MFAKHLKHIVIAFGIVLLFLLWYTHAQSQQHKQPNVTISTHKKVHNGQNLQRKTHPFKSIKTQPSPRTTRFQDADFYRTIIHNNLFRPLGWTRPVPPPAYRLTGTIIPKDGNTGAQALILATASNKTHIVNIGGKLGTDTTVPDIQPKQVTLENAGKQITLKLDTSLWMNTSNGRSPHRR